MASDALKREAKRAWRDLEEAEVRAYPILSGWKKAADRLQVLSEADDEQLKTFTASLRKQAEEARSMKFVGEK